VVLILEAVGKGGDGAKKQMLNVEGRKDERTEAVTR